MNIISAVNKLDSIFFECEVIEVKLFVCNLIKYIIVVKIPIIQKYKYIIPILMNKSFVRFVKYECESSSASSSLIS